MRPRARVLGALLAGLLAASPAPLAHANQRQESIVQDDNLLLYRGDHTSDRTFDELARLGVDRVRLSVPWRALAPSPKAPTRPAQLHYRDRDFAPWDHAVRAAHARGMDVLFNVTGGAPIWATGTRRGTHVSRQYKPSATEFARFVQVLGDRYPSVRAWSIWNEPNYGAFLQPQWEHGVPASPAIYRALVRGALRGLRRSGHGDDIILLGETSPTGVDQHTTTSPMRPALFLRELLCLDQDLVPIIGPGCDFESRGRLEVTGYGHHPYPIMEPPAAPSEHRDDLRLGDELRLTTILDAAAGAGRIPPELPLWYTEFGWQTPPDPVRGVPLAQQARWIAQAEHLTFDDDRVVAMAQFQLRDDPPRRAYPRSSPRYWGTYQSGLRFADGRAKPAYAAYRLPFDLGRDGRLWGLVRPAIGGEPIVQIEHRAPGAAAFRPLGDPIRVFDPAGDFELDPRAGPGEYRFTWRGLASNAVAVGVG